jgi:hypothetical protein
MRICDAKRLHDANLDHEKMLLFRQVEATDAAIDSTECDCLIFLRRKIFCDQNFKININENLLFL